MIDLGCGDGDPTTPCTPCVPCVPCPPGAVAARLLDTPRCPTPSPARLLPVPPHPWLNPPAASACSIIRRRIELNPPPCHRGREVGKAGAIHSASPPASPPTSIPCITSGGDDCRPVLPPFIPPFRFPLPLPFPLPFRLSFREEEPLDAPLLDAPRDPPLYRGEDTWRPPPFPAPPAPPPCACAEAEKISWSGGSGEGSAPGSPAPGLAGAATTMRLDMIRSWRPSPSPSTPPTAEDAAPDAGWDDGAVPGTRVVLVLVGCVRPGGGEARRDVLHLRAAFGPTRGSQWKVDSVASAESGSNHRELVDAVGGVARSDTPALPARGGVVVGLALGEEAGAQFGACAVGDAVCIGVELRMSLRAVPVLCRRRC